LIVSGIDTIILEGEAYPRIHLKAVSDESEFDPTVLVIGSDLNNRVHITGIDGVPRIYDEISIFFGEKNVLNGCYRVCKIGTTKYGNKIHPMIQVVKIGDLKRGIISFNLFDVHPVECAT